MKKKTLAWTVREIKTGDIWPMWITKSKENLKYDIKNHRLTGALKIIRVEIKEVKRIK